MKTPIALHQMNSILEAARTCDDTMAILEDMNINGGVQVVPDGDRRAMDVAVSFMYPNGARAALKARRSGGSQMQQFMHEVKTVEQAKAFKPSEIVYPAHVVLGGNGSFIVTFRDIPQAITQGDDFTDMMEMATDALSTALEFYFEDNILVPPPSAFQHGEIGIALSVVDATSVKAQRAVQDKHAPE